MATSGVSTGIMTGIDLCRAAGRMLGVISSGEDLDGDESEDMRVILNGMLKSWQLDGCNLWRDSDATATIAANTARTTLPYLDATDVNIVVSATYQRPLTRWELGQYRRIPNKSAQGAPTIYCIDRKLTGLDLIVWPVPTAATTLTFAANRVIEDVVDLAQDIDVPQEWMEAVWTCLAARAIPMFGVARLDPATTNMITARAAQLEAKALDFDRPASIYIGRD